MAQRTKGKCKYCGKEYTMGYMNQHLPKCKERQNILAEEKGTRSCGYFELAISSRYSKTHWLFLEVRENAELKDLDAFLRDIWVECCGHLSAFHIDGESYEVVPADRLWGEPSKSMKYQLKTLLEKGMTFYYEYDYGSTTELMITVVNYRIGRQHKEKITILSRNNPPVYECEECGKPAAVICMECHWEGGGYLCEECAETHECGEEMQLDLCNSPRCGVCGYCGSDVYPDQFLSDPELEVEKVKKIRYRK